LSTSERTPEALRAPLRLSALRGLQQQPTAGDDTHSNAGAIAHRKPSRIADPHPIRAGLPDPDPMPLVLQPCERAAVAARDEHRVRLDSVPGPSLRRPRRHHQQRHVGMGRRSVDPKGVERDAINPRRRRCRRRSPTSRGGAVRGRQVRRLPGRHMALERRLAAGVSRAQPIPPDRSRDDLRPGSSFDSAVWRIWRHAARRHVAVGWQGLGQTVTGQLAAGSPICPAGIRRCAR
jgi:hypothetical protein